MGFAKLIRKGYAVADKLTADLQVPVIVEPFDKVDKNTKPLYLTQLVPTPTAIVKISTRVVMVQTHASANTESVVAARKVSFLRNLTIKMRDRLTLPDGTVGPVVAISAMPDPAGGVYGPTVWITSER